MFSYFDADQVIHTFEYFLEIFFYSVTFENQDGKLSLKELEHFWYKIVKQVKLHMFLRINKYECISECRVQMSYPSE